jgi:hypothetical protein
LLRRHICAGSDGRFARPAGGPCRKYGAAMAAITNYLIDFISFSSFNVI